MAKGKNQHVVPSGNGWAVKSAGASKPSSRHRTQGAAANQAVKNAKQEKCEVVIHRPNGQIRDSDSYGNDPNPPRDTKN